MQMMMTVTALLPRQVRLACKSCPVSAHRAVAVGQAQGEFKSASQQATPVQQLHNAVAHALSAVGLRAAAPESVGVDQRALPAHQQPQLRVRRQQPHVRPARHRRQDAPRQVQLPAGDNTGNGLIQS